MALDHEWRITKNTMHQCLISLLQYMVNFHECIPNLSKVLLRDNTNTIPFHGNEIKYV